MKFFSVLWILTLIIVSFLTSSTWSFVYSDDLEKYSDDFEKSFPNILCEVLLAPGIAELCMHDNARKGRHAIILTDLLLSNLFFVYITFCFYLIAKLIQKCQKNKKEPVGTTCIWNSITNDFIKKVRKYENKIVNP